MKLKSVLLAALFFVTLSAEALSLKDGITISDIKEIISADKIYLEPLLQREDYEALLEIEKSDLEGDYIKSLYSVHPERIDSNYIESGIKEKFDGNKRLFSEKKASSKHFMQIYYVIKLIETHEIVGTFEIFDEISAPEFGLFIRSTHSGKKYGKEATNAAIQFLKEKTKARYVKWACNSDNPSSVGIATACGFSYLTDLDVYEGRTAKQFGLSLAQ